jgi:hypothetical protein
MRLGQDAEGTGTTRTGVHQIDAAAIEAPSDAVVKDSAPDRSPRYGGLPRERCSRSRRVLRRQRAELQSVGGWRRPFLDQPRKGGRADRFPAPPRRRNHTRVALPASTSELSQRRWGPIREHRKEMSGPVDVQCQDVETLKFNSNVIRDEHPWRSHSPRVKLCASAAVIGRGHGADRAAGH